jgi:hypothetical protein
VQSAVDGVCVLTHAVSSEEIIEQVWPVPSALTFDLSPRLAVRPRSSHAATHCSEY